MTKDAVFRRGLKQGLINCSKTTFDKCIPPWIKPMRFLQGAISVACQSCYNLDSQLNSLGAHDLVEDMLRDTVR